MSYQQESIYGLVGYPVEHSLSPVMHNSAFAELGVPAEYKLFSLREEELDEFFEALRDKDSPIFGLNITVPYKEKVIKYLDSMSPYAQRVRAVNTIVISNNRELTGHNTDGPGFLAHLQELNFEIQSKRVAVIGAGGVCRAIVSALCLLPQKPFSIKIYDVEKGKSEKVIADLKNNGLNIDMVLAVSAFDDLNIEISDLLINATPIGMHKGDPCIVDEELLHSSLYVYDVIYNPAETPLLKAAKQKGAKVSNGLGMLFFQGVLAFQHWANAELEDSVKEKMYHSLIKGIKTC